VSGKATGAAAAVDDGTTTTVPPWQKDRMVKKESAGVGMSKKTQNAMHRSLDDIDFDFSSVKGGGGVGATSFSKPKGDKALDPPPFVSPLRSTAKGTWQKPTPSGGGGGGPPAYEGTMKLKPPPAPPAPSASSSFMSQAVAPRTPSFRSKPRVFPGATQSFEDGLMMSPSPVASSSTKGVERKKSWMDQISFQATPSPGALKKQVVNQSTFNQSFGGSYLQLSPGPLKGSVGGGKSYGTDDDFEETPDIQIEVKIPDIEKKMQARRELKLQQQHPHIKAHTEEKSVPEWMLKQREWEANVKRRQKEKENDMASLIQAIFRGWRARSGYQDLKIKHRDRILAMKKREKLEKKRLAAAVRIQKTWRMIVPRKRYLFLKECRRRREKNQKEINRITKVIAKMPKKTKAGKCDS